MSSTKIGSDFKWMIGLYTPVSLGCSFKGEDLTNTGINFDSSMSIINADIIFSKNKLLDDIGMILGDEYFTDLITLCSSEDNQKPVFDMFELNSMNGDSNSDYVILRLKESTDLYKKLRLLHKGISVKYDITPLEGFEPHIKLAEVRKGEADKYTFSGNLKTILNDSLFDPEDLAITINHVNEKEVTNYLTHYKNVDRFFRLIHLKEENDELFEDEQLNYL